MKILDIEESDLPATWRKTRWSADPRDESNAAVEGSKLKSTNTREIYE